MRAVPRADDARAVAWRILQAVEDGGYADALLGSALSGADLAARDQALTARLVYGTLAWQGYLDHILAAFSQKRVEKLDAPIRCLLRMALLQICKLDRVPTFAAVNTAVSLSKRHRSGAASGYVNAVLRRASTGWEKVPLGKDDLATRLAVTQSHPRWLVEAWLGQFGDTETTALLAANNDAAPTTVRVNPLRSNRDRLCAQLQSAGITTAACTYSPFGLVVHDAVKPDALPGFAEGMFTIQSEASQLVSLLVSPRPGERLLDACAAPGGKTTHLAELMSNEGEVIALDIHAAGVATIERRARHLGLSAIRARVADAAVWPAEDESFDSVLVDAPCSGLGTLRQHPEIRWRRSPDDIAQLAHKQTRILHHLAGSVRRGGVLVYSTCTLIRDENDAQITRFLNENGDFTIDDPRPFLPAAAAELCDSTGYVRMLPHRHGLDGFFAVRLKRRYVAGKGAT